MKSSLKVIPCLCDPRVHTSQGKNEGIAAGSLSSHAEYFPISIITDYSRHRGYETIRVLYGAMFSLGFLRFLGLFAGD